MGLSFESLVVNNYAEILPYLHLGGALVTSAAPYQKRGRRGAAGTGFQIDLLVQTEGAICVVECKRKRVIDKEVIQEVDRKVRKIARPDGVSIRTALVYDGELSAFVETNGYFDALIPLKSVIGL